MPCRTMSCGGIWLMSMPFLTMRPERARNRPQMVRTRVVLPAPLAPTIATASRSPTESETSCSTVSAP